MSTLMRPRVRSCYDLQSCQERPNQRAWGTSRANESVSPHELSQ